MLKIQPLASGSRGNATLISDGVTNILVDIGLSLPILLKRLQAAEIDPATISAVVITHEHNDHIGGVARFVNRFGAKLYLHASACRCIAKKIPGLGAECIETFNKPFTVGEITVDFFSLPHDSEFCFGYIFQSGQGKISYATDLGSCGSDILQKMEGSQIVLLECNHCLVKLRHNVTYPHFLKKRIAGPLGHLSNDACCNAVYKLWQMGVRQVILAHLSKENNSPQVAYQTVARFLETKGLAEGTDIYIDVATQDEVGNVFQID